jgi:hypothetical protein
LHTTGNFGAERIKRASIAACGLCSGRTKGLLSWMSKSTASLVGVFRTRDVRRTSSADIFSARARERNKQPADHGMSKPAIGSPTGILECSNSERAPEGDIFLQRSYSRGNSGDARAASSSALTHPASCKVPKTPHFSNLRLTSGLLNVRIRVRSDEIHDDGQTVFGCCDRHSSTCGGRRGPLAGALARCRSLSWVN